MQCWAQTLLGLTPPPQAFPRETRARGLMGHLVFGVASESVLRLADAARVSGPLEPESDARGEGGRCAGRGRSEAPMIDPFDAYPPPLVLTSDMILVGAACPPEPIRRTFPHLALRTLGGKALLGIWFSRVLQIRAGRDGNIRLTPSEAPNDLPYQELNVAVLLRGRRLFVPGIYATSELTLRLGHRYGMPKEPAAMSYHGDASEVRSEVVVHGTTSRVAARPLPGGRWLGGLARRTLPWWSWRTQFPSGSSIEGHVEGAEGARLVRLTHGRLALDAPWLPHPTSLWPIGLHVPRQTMTLPDPDRGQP